MTPRRKRPGTSCQPLEFKPHTSGAIILVCGLLLACCASCENPAFHSPCRQRDSQNLNADDRILIINSNLLLVRARVAATTIDGDCVQAELNILEVVCGDERFVGRPFVATSAAASNPRVIYHGAVSPELRLGEVGFWLLQQYKSVWAPQKVKAFGIPWPVREVATPRFEERVELIAAIRAMDHEKDAQKQFAGLKQYAESRTTEVSAWAIDVLAGQGPQTEVTPFLITLVAQGTLTAGAETRADAALLNAAGATWRQSLVRQRMFDRWVSGPVTESDGLRAIAWLIDLAQKPQESGVEPARLLALAKRAIDNPSWSLKARGRALGIATWTARINDEHTAAFDLLANVIENADEPELKVLAARTIRSGIELTTGRRERLRVLERTVNDRKVAEVLREILGLTDKVTPDHL